MYTVVIAEQEHLDSIQEYSAFLRPFLANKDVAFCPWDTEGQTLDEAVPGLVTAVARNQEWRAIVVCNEQGLKQRNPFNIISYNAPEKDEDNLLEYLAECRERKFQAYEEAARQPLTRLMTILCERPTVSGGKNNADEEDPEFAEYRAEAQRKEELRKSILAEQEIHFFLPREVICVAKRTCTEQEPHLHSSWVPHVELEYSKFYDWNMYFDKMRYLVFDILPRTHQDYQFDYVRFLYFLLILANHQVPEDCLHPNRVYTASCENDESALRRLIVTYDEKLRITEDHLEREMGALQARQKPRLSDSDASAIFCANVTVPVTIDAGFERSDLFADYKKYGLSTDCPTDEFGEWQNDYQQSRKALHRFLKQPRRSLKKAAEQLQALSYVDKDLVPQLNQFQLEDVEEYVTDAELKMARIETKDFWDVSRYHKEMEQADKVVQDKINTRMTKAGTVALGAVALVCFAIGFLPLIFNNLGNAKTTSLSVIFLASGVGLLAIAAVVCLLFLRKGLTDRVQDFNGIMGGITNDVDASMQEFSKYLGYAGNVLRGTSVLEYYQTHTDPEVLQVRVRKKHRMDIKQVRAELADIFGQYLTDRTVVDPESIQGYRYNFDRYIDFPYPVPYSDKNLTSIEYMQSGSQVLIPVDFVKRISTRLEELYD